jgi:hypothetical protein
MMVLACCQLAALFAGIGRNGPDFKARDFDGKIHQRSDYKGKIIVLEFYDLECPACRLRYETGLMQKLQREFTAKGVIWLAVSSIAPDSPAHRTPEQMKKEWAAQKIGATAWLDDSDRGIAFSNGVSSIPELRILDAKGIMSYAGPVDEAASGGDRTKGRNFAREVLTNLLEGDPVRMDNTSALNGCPLKVR